MFCLSLFCQRVINLSFSKLYFIFDLKIDTNICAYYTDSRYSADAVAGTPHSNEFSNPCSSLQWLLFENIYSIYLSYLMTSCKQFRYICFYSIICHCLVLGWIKISYINIIWTNFGAYDSKIVFFKLSFQVLDMDQT